MKLGLIETFSQFAARRDNSVSQDDLMVFRKRYNVYETEMDEIIQLCGEHDIKIVNTEDSVPKKATNRNCMAGMHLSEEERRKYRKMVRTIAGLIVNKGSIRARKRTEGRGWICGTYTSRIRTTIEKRLGLMFTYDQIEFIYSHLPEEYDDETELVLQDPENHELCDEISEKLNTLIPKIYVNHYWSDFLSD